MLSFEREFREFVRGTSLELIDNTSSTSLLDFTLIGKKQSFHVEIKEKRQHYNLDNWLGVMVPEEHLFILDDLSARLILAAGPHSGLVVRDNLTSFYYFFSLLSLFLMPKVRCNRIVGMGAITHVKGKWALDLRNGVPCTSVHETMKAVGAYFAAWDEIASLSPCYGSFIGEEILDDGIPRTAKYREKDYSETR